MLLAFFYLLPAHAEPVDLVVLGDAVLTMTPRGVIHDGAVAIRADEIVAVGDRTEILANYTPAEILPGENRVVMPGLINGHTHTGMTLFRGMVDDLDLETWLNRYVFPMEARFVNPAFIRVGSTLACYEMIRSGVTTFVDMYFYPAVIAEVVHDCGLRAIVTSPSIDLPSPGFEGWQDSFAAAKSFVASHQGKYPRVTPGFAPHAPYTVSVDHLREVAAAAGRLDAPVSMHLAEAPFEVTLIRERHDMTPVMLAREVGLLSDRLIAAHVVHPDPSDYQLLATSGAGVIHNPTSNLKVAAGISPVTGMLAAGVRVGLGTDGAASNNDLDLLEEVRMAALLHKERERDPTAVPALQALLMATAGGAEAIGKGTEIGRLKAGYQADLVQVALDRTGLQPVYDVVSHLVYVVDSADMVTTIVAGRILMRDGVVRSIDRDALDKAVRAESERIRASLAATGP